MEDLVAWMNDPSAVDEFIRTEFAPHEVTLSVVDKKGVEHTFRIDAEFHMCSVYFEDTFAVFESVFDFVRYIERKYDLV